jgi:acyl-CoA reductase-like NAD-dependent aldehyde dehydrogenase
MAVETMTHPMKCRMLVDGDWRKSDEQIEIKSPYTHETVGTTYLAGIGDVEGIIKSSISGFEAMRKLPSYSRCEVLHGITRRLRDRREELARTMTLESGKPIRDSRAEVDRAVLTFTIAREEAKRLSGETIPLDLNQVSEGRFGIIRRFPIGPILGITPFNFPLNLVAHKVAPALASGNSIIVKPSLRTPLTSLLLGEIALDAGVPKGGLNVVPCSNDVTHRFVTDDRLKMITDRKSVV